MKIALTAGSWLVALPLAIVTASWPQRASADQCQWIQEPAAQAAAKIIREHPDLRLYCAPCRDSAVTVVRAFKTEVQQADMRGRSQPFKAVWITDYTGKRTELDLAYTYVQMDARSPVYTNLAKLAACPASDVPETIGPAGPPAQSPGSAAPRQPLQLQ